MEIKLLSEKIERLSKEFVEMKTELKAALKEFDATCHIINEITATNSAKLL
jgi:predicted  nucleic acid-binding Zn-ribbon protein